MTITTAPASTLVIFGASGDLTKRLLMPALYNLAGSGLLDPDFKVVGVGRSPGNDEEFRAKQLAFMKTFGHKTEADADADLLNHAAWNWLEERLYYVSGDTSDPLTIQRIAEYVGDGNAVFFLAVPSESFTPVADALHESGLMRETPERSRRLVVEKPFGHDLATAKELNHHLLGMFEEQQIYRIDHFLGKETVQNILALRFANTVFEPLWNAENVANIQITAAETVGVEQRAGFYESTGALRDMVPNHLFQLLALIAMERPATLEADDVRDAKTQLLQAIRPLEDAPLEEQVVRGQYLAGVVNNKQVRAYTDEPNVDPKSRTETYVAMKLKVDNPRWKDVPFYLRTGKHMTVRRTEIVVTFKPSSLAPDASCANVLLLRLQPDEGAAMYVNVKKPGQGLTLVPVPLDFGYAQAFATKPSTGYESLMYDVLTGNPALYNRADSIEAGWEKVQPILDAVTGGIARLHTYTAGSAGPVEADDLLEGDDQWRSLA